MTKIFKNPLDNYRFMSYRYQKKR